MFKRIIYHPLFIWFSAVDTVLGFIGMAVDFIEWWPISRDWSIVLASSGGALLSLVVIVKVSEWILKNRKPKPVEIHLGNVSLGEPTAKLSVEVVTVPPWYRKLWYRFWLGLLIGIKEKVNFILISKIAVVACAILFLIRIFSVQFEITEKTPPQQSYRIDVPHTQSEKETVTNPVPVEELIENPQDEPDKPDARIFTPRTTKELMDMAITQTRRDAMRNKGVWIRVEGTVLDISPDRLVRFDPENRHIEVTVGVGSQPHNEFSQTVELHLNADRWRRQVNKLGRGDWLVANGTVYHVLKTFIVVINGEIISVLGKVSKNQQKNEEEKRK